MARLYRKVGPFSWKFGGNPSAARSTFRVQNLTLEIYTASQYNTSEVILMGVRAWDEDFDKEFFTPEEIAESDARADAIAKQINEHVGHGGLLPFGREAVDA